MTLKELKFHASIAMDEARFIIGDLKEADPASVLKWVETIEFHMSRIREGINECIK